MKKNREKLKRVKDYASKRSPLTMLDVDLDTGLSQEQVRERVDKGHSNKVKISTSKSGWQIFASNFFNVFNILCFVILIWLLTVCVSLNDLKDCMFICIISANIIIGIFQEFKAKKIIDKMSLSVAPKSHVLRDGKICELQADKIVRDDIISFNAGDGIPADSIVVSGKVYVNESMLTGESNSIEKNVGDLLLSGSYIVSGSAKARVSSIAEECYIQNLAKEAKQFKTAKSVLMTNLYTLLKVLAIIVIVFSVPSFINNFNAQLVTALENVGEYSYSKGFWTAIFDYSNVKTLIGGAESVSLAYRMAVKSTVTVLEGMIPSGMMLLTSVTLAVGVIKISAHKAMVQGLYSIETLARVNLMCLDKTGTLTDGTMQVKDFKVLTNKFTESEVYAIVSKMEHTLEDNNATALALKEHFNCMGDYTVKSFQNFDSDKKYSKVEFEGLGTFYVGAPEYIMNLQDGNEKIIKLHQNEGLRVLLIAQEKDGEKEAIGYVIIEDNIKPTAKQTIEYFKKNNVGIRIISGDNPITVSHIAKVVGVDGYDEFVSAQGLSDEELLEKAKTCMVFGRVNPHQKKLLIKFYKENGNTVAMTGDGINDILALKEADCAIAMVNGADATKNVAHIVLMDSDFKSMPHIVLEGRRVINNVERASTLFLTKTLTIFLFQLLYIILQRAVPITPINLAFVNIICIGIPSFFVALEENTKKLEGNFFINILKKIIPCALTIFASILTLTLLHENGALQVTDGQFTTLLIISMYSVFTILLIDICLPLTKKKGILCGSVVLVGLLYFGIICDLFESNAILNIFSLANIYSLECLVSIAGVVAWSIVSIVLFKLLFKYLKKIEFLKKLKIKLKIK